MPHYLTDNLPHHVIKRAAQTDVVAVNLYPAGATTNSDAGVTDMRKTYRTLEAMQREGLVLLVHGEVTSPDIDLFDREAVFIDQQLMPLRKDFPGLKIVMEHITTREAAHLKEHAVGCAGCYTGLNAMELYAEAFDNAGAIGKLEGFASFHGADFYGLPRNTGTLALRRESWTVPEQVPFGEAQLKPLRA